MVLKTPHVTSSGGLLLVGVSAAVILTHFVGVNLTHLGEDGGLLAAADVDSGASSGNQGLKTKRGGVTGDRTRARMLGHDGQAISARRDGSALRTAAAQADEAGHAQAVSS